MDNLKRVAIFLAIATLTVIVSVSYRGNDILKRAIILGVGVDVAEEGLEVTAEIVSPGNGGEQVGTFSKIVSAKGKTVAEALQNIAEKTGKETSLGQCVLLVYGEEFAAQGFDSTAEYFALSDSFKESSTVCCCKGTAKELLNCGDALLQSVSLSIADKIKGQSKDIAVPSCDLLTFARSQRELFKTGFLNYVYYELSQNQSGENPNQKQVFFRCNRVAVFRENKMIGVLSEQETQGFAILQKDVAGNVFSVVDEEENMVTLRANSKNVDISAENDKVRLQVKLFVKLARTDSFGASGQFSAKSEKEISQDSLAQAKEQAVELAKLFLNKQVEWEFDLLEIHEIFRQKQGTTKQVENLQMKDLTYSLSLTVQEK